MKPCIAIAIAAILGTAGLRATDHTDMTNAKERAPFDIADLFAFPVEDGRLVLAMTVHPFAKKKSRFMEEVDYVFRLRPARLTDSGSGSPVKIGASEVRIVCEPKGDEIHVAAIGPGGRRIGSPVVTTFNAAPEAGEANAPIRVFAGLRAEPFISDFFKVRKKKYPDAKPRFPRIPASLDFFARASVLALVVEIDVNRVLGSINRGRPLLVVGAEAISHDHDTGAQNQIVDRQGRAEITQFLVALQKGGEEHKENEDLWNAEDTFNTRSKKRAELRAFLRAGLEEFDVRDSGDDWREGDSRTEAFLDLLLDDVLVLDLSKPPLSGGSTANTFFEIEHAALTGRRHHTCGGRTPNDDVIDTTLTLFVRGLDAPPELRISDGLDSALRPASDEFPYLAKPFRISKLKFPPLLR